LLGEVLQPYCNRASTGQYAADMRALLNRWELHK
jgi:hypothetical protein